MDKISPFIIRNSRNRQDLAKRFCTSCGIFQLEPIGLMKLAKDTNPLRSLENLKENSGTTKTVTR